jgi:hypothetical protein
MRTEAGRHRPTRVVQARENNPNNTNGFNNLWADIQWPSHCQITPSLGTLSSNPAVTEILSYFLRNPNAADDLEGIARWRLLNEMVHRKVEETDLALKSLVACGLMIESTGPGMLGVFSLNEGRIDEARQIVALRQSEAQEPY